GETRVDAGAAGCGDVRERVRAAADGDGDDGGTGLCGGARETIRPGRRPTGVGGPGARAAEREGGYLHQLADKRLPNRGNLMNHKPPSASQTTSIHGRRLVQQRVLGPLAVVAWVVMVLVWKFPGVNFLKIPVPLLFGVCVAVFGLYLAVTALAWRCPK